MRDLFIIGAGGSSRDIIELVEDINRDRPIWSLCGVLDDNPATHGTSICDVPVIGSTTLPVDKQAALVIGIASSRNRAIKQKVAERLGLAPARFATLIHPSASVSPRAAIGEGSVILHNVVIGPQVTIGRHVLICAGTTIGHDAKISDYVSMAPHIGISGSVVVGENAYLGSGARFREGVNVGSGSLVGIGAVVVKDVEQGTTVFGNPARMYR